MEGVVLVELSSGCLHYTKSFSETFDSRHPKSERLNFSALIFALQSFAGSSIHPASRREITSAATGGADIAMLCTPLENMVLAPTPSNKLLVVLFTTPYFEAEVAKYLVRRVAYHYENPDTTDVQLMAVLNQVARRFRQAFSQAIDDTLERELIYLSERVILAPSGISGQYEGFSGENEMFLFFSYSAGLGASTSVATIENSDGRVACPDDQEDECRKAVRPSNPTLALIPRGSGQSLNIRCMIASTRAIVAVITKGGSSKTKIPRKKFRWRARNAVMNHSKPGGFQRVIGLRYHERKAAMMEPHRTGKAYAIADILLPFVELSLFASVSKVAQQRSQQLDQIEWKNIPSSTSTKVGNRDPQPANDIIAWRSGSCLIFYPTTTMSWNPQDKSKMRHAVVALFDVADPLLKAKTNILA